MIFRRTDNTKPKTIKKIFPTSPVEVLALQNFLEEMSESGYMLTGAYGSIYDFRECEPQKRRFQVDFFSKASIFDSRPERKTEEYIEYCKSAGWTHCFGNGKMQFFYTEDMEIPEIETDDVFRFQSITKAEVLSRITIWVLAILYAFLGMNSVRNTMDHYIQWARFISSPMALGLVLFSSMYAIGAVISFAGFMTFYIGNKKRINRGESIDLYSPEQVRRRVRYRMMGLGILLLALILMTIQSASQWVITLVTLGLFILFALISGRFMKSRYSNRKTNLIMSLVIVFAISLLTNMTVLGVTFFGETAGNIIDSEDVDDIHIGPVPISLKEMGYEVLDEGSVHEETFAEEDKSFMASFRSFSTGIGSDDGYNRNPETDRIFPFYDMSVFESEFSWIMDRYRALFVNQEDMIPDAQFPYPELVEQGYEGYMTEEVVEENQTTRLLLVKDGKAILVVSHEPLSEENILLLLKNI